MRFKRIAFLFIVFANILMMAHSIVPHHHHNGLVNNLNTQTRNESNTHNFNNHSHENDDDTYCALNKEILIPGKSIRPGADQQNRNTEDHFFQDINYAILQSAVPDSGTGSLSLYRDHYCFSQYLFLLNNSRGLRAPPLS